MTSIASGISLPRKLKRMTSPSQVGRAVLSHRIFRWLITTLTVWSLFADEIRYGSTDTSTVDTYFDASLLFCAFVFILEIILQVVFKPSYVMSFICAVDIVSTAALIGDLSWTPFASRYGLSDSGSPIPSIILTSCQQLRAIRLVRVLQTSGPVMYFMNRITSSYEAGHPDTKSHALAITRPTYLGTERKRSKRTSLISEATTDLGDDDEELDMQLRQERADPALRRILNQSESLPRRNENDSHVGRKLDEINAKRVGLLVILCATVAQLVVSAHESIEGTVFILNEFSVALQTGNRAIITSAFGAFSDALASDLPRPAWLITPLSFGDLGLPSTQCGDGNRLVHVFPSYSACPETSDLRTVSITTYSLDSVEIRVDRTAWVRQEAMFGLGETLFLFGILLAVSLLFQYDCSVLILIPIRRMVSTLRKIQENPLCANILIEESQRSVALYREASHAWAALPWWNRLFRCKPRVLRGQSPLSSNESTKLQATILKLGSLLLVGFGEAGAEVVGANIKGALGQIVTARPGRKLEAVFGYINICDFETVTEVLQDSIVLLVNQVAEIVHGIVDEFNGVVFKNTGSGFLVLWKPVNGGAFADQKERLAELAIVACCQIMAALDRSPILQIYREHPRLKQVIPGYKVRLTAALHAGTAFEGALGSELKLDASYLGSDVVLTQTLDAFATSTYRTSLVLSGAVVSLTSVVFRTSLCRRIDLVDINSSVIPLFTIDLECPDLWTNIPEGSPKLQKTRTRMSDFDDSGDQQAKRERKKLKLTENGYIPIKAFEANELGIMRRKFSSPNGHMFLQIFNKGFLNFECGEYAVARRTLMHCLVFWIPRGRNLLSSKWTLTCELLDSISTFPNHDGPSLVLLRRLEAMESAMDDSHTST